MSHYLIELAVWMLLVYLLGCLVGWAVKNLFFAEAPVAQPVVAPPVAKPAPVPQPLVAKPVDVAPVPVPVRPAAVAQPAPVADPQKVSRPKGLSAARGGKADDLQRISGIGPKNEAILHNLGFFHFDQIAAWTPGEVAWVDEHLRFNGRIQREEWIRQAGLLAEGKDEQFAREYGTGGLKGKDGQTHSGTHTRKS